MNTERFGAFVPRWVWAASGVAVVLVAAGILWDWSTGAPERVGAGPVGYGDMSKSSENPASPVSQPRAPRVGVIKAGPPPSPKLKTVATKPCAGRSKAAVVPISPRAMFPMGDVTRGLPRAPIQVYRPITEGFPSFGYGERIWVFTGRYVSSDKVDIVTTGLVLNGRKLLALANTAGPGSVLFVQTVNDPGKFAIYRSPCVDNRCVWR